MAYTDISDIRCSNVTVTAGSNNTVYATLDTANITDILEGINLSEIVSYYGAKDLLSEIGHKEASEYFDLVERKDEE